MSNGKGSVNIFKRMKRHFVMKKIENHNKNSKTNVAVIIINILLVAIVAAIYYYAFFVNPEKVYQIGAVALLVFVIIAFVIQLLGSDAPPEKVIVGISKLILIDDPKIQRKEWLIHGKPSVVIGKSSPNNVVDVDLSSVEYGSTVSRMHAVLNYAGNGWFLEDLGSANGVGLQKAKDNSKKRLQPDTPYRLDKGDIIYIANVKLMIG